MSFNLNTFLRNNRLEEDPRMTRQLRCADGFQVSVQASVTHYCNPRENNAYPYDAVECGFPSEPDELLEKHRERGENIFPWTPVEVVEAVVEKHGGLDPSMGYNMVEFIPPPPPPTPFTVYVVVCKDRAGNPRGVEKTVAHQFYFTAEEAETARQKLFPEFIDYHCVAECSLAILGKVD